jgi:hypothetical protein
VADTGIPDKLALQEPPAAKVDPQVVPNIKMLGLVATTEHPVAVTDPLFEKL